MFPGTKIVDSDSYVFGFNNKISILCAAAFIFIFYFTGIIFGNSSSCRIFTENNESTCVDRRLYIIIALLLTGYNVMLYFLVGKDWHGEGTYFIRRIDFMLMGKIPYRDFYFDYGPALIYVPAYFHVLMSKFGFSVRSSYYIVLTIGTIFNLSLFAFIIRWFDIPVKYKNIIFAVFSLLSWNPSAGINYIAIRFILPFVFILYIHRLLFDKDKIKSKVLLLILLSVISTFITIAISPEIGISYYITLIAYITYLRIRDGKQYIICLIIHILATPLILSYIFPKDYFASIINFSKGGNAFPVLPVFYIFAYLFCLFYTVPLQLKSLKIPGYNNAINLALAVFTVCTIPGAMSRCDIGHIFWYGLTVMMITPVILLIKYPASFKYYMTVFTIIMTVYTVAHFNFLYYGIVNRLYVYFVTGHHPREYEYLNRDFSRLDRYEDPISVPFDPVEDLERYLKSRGTYKVNYFDEMRLIHSEEDVIRKIKDVRTNKLLIIPGRYKDMKAYDETAARHEIIRKLFLYPFNRKPQKPFFQPSVILMAYIRSNYHIIDEVNDYYLLECNNE